MGETSVPNSNIVCKIILRGSSTLSRMEGSVISTDGRSRRIVFMIPGRFASVDSVITRFGTISVLHRTTDSSGILFSRCRIVCRSLHRIVNSFVGTCARPRGCGSQCVCLNRRHAVNQGTTLANLVSSVYSELFTLAPIVGGRTVGGSSVASVTCGDHDGVVSNLLEGRLRGNLNLANAKRRMSVVHDALVHANILVRRTKVAGVGLYPRSRLLTGTLGTVISFVQRTHRGKGMGFTSLCCHLADTRCRVNVHGNLVLVCITTILRRFGRDMLVVSQFNRIPASASMLLRVGTSPNSFCVACLS